MIKLSKKEETILQGGDKIIVPQPVPGQTHWIVGGEKYDLEGNRVEYGGCPDCGHCLNLDTNGTCRVTVTKQYGNRGPCGCYCSGEVKGGCQFHREARNQHCPDCIRRASSA